MKSSFIACRSLRFLERLGLSLLAATAASQAAALDLADQPLFSTVAVPGNLTLALSVEWPTATTPAYPTAAAYDTASTFLGYFDSAKCYQYTVVNSGTTGAPIYSTSYFAPYGAASSHACTSTSTLSLWSGNYLNWATMQTLDAFRWVLTGGYRSVDTTSATILTKTYAAMDSNVMPQKTVGTSFLSGATPFTGTGFSSGATTRLRNIGSRMWITSSATGGSSLVNGSATTGATAYTGQNNNVATANAAYAAAGTTYELFVNVKVCDSTVGLETNCKLYGTSTYKPEGLMQAYSSKLRYSAFGYYNHDGTTTQQRDGGVMRARMKYIAPTQPVPGSTPITNSVTEWSSTTGIMVTNPDTTDASDTVTRASAAGYTVAISDSGVMNYLNKFGYSSQSYKSKDPVSELYYAALRYFKNLGNVASYTTLSGAGDSATAAKWLDGFPAIATWDDPIVYTCQKNFILGIGDVNTHRDANLPGSTLRASSSLEPTLPSEVVADTTVNVATATNMVGKMEGYSGSLANIFGDSGSTSCSGTGSQCNSYYIAGLAYDAHTKDIRSDLAGIQTVNTYWMDVLEGQVYKHKNQYWLAAKYGGFDYTPPFDTYNSGNGTTTIPTTAWYTTSDTMTRVSPVPSAELAYSTDVSTTTPDSRPDNYFPGNRPDLMKSGLTTAFSKIVSEAAGANSTAFSSASPNVTNTGSVSYAATYDPGAWTGQVIASTVVYATDGTPTLTPQWDARSLLSAPAVTSSTRKIVTCCTTSTTSPGLAFTDALLTSSTLISRTNYTSFSAVPGVTTQSKANYLLYLRGDTSKELAHGGVYRTRAYRLGDIVNSKPVPVGVPNAAYTDGNNPGYSAFKTAQIARKTVVYVGANDGMLHAFDGSIGNSASGSELFAYIPSFVYGTTTTAPVSGLASLGNPSFTHHYFVDATPGQFDVDFKNTYLSTSTVVDWHTLLIGGLGKGGNGYYALDITDPTTWTSEANVAGKVLWEFTNSHMGSTFGTPSVVKTRKYGWVVVMTSGYNNDDGVGYFFFVNPKTGALLETVATTSGSTTAPIDLGQHSAYVSDYTDQTADAIYAGDMQGNVWRLDVTPATGSYAQPTLIATLKDTATPAVGQPVTTRPLIETVPSTNKRYVLIGTGRLLADSDIASSQVQSFYAIADGLGTDGGFYVTSSLPSGVTFPITRAKLNANTSLSTGIGSSPTSAMGWYFDLPVVTTTSPASSIAQRVDVDPSANAGIVAFAGNTPNGSACSPAGTGTVYAVAFAAGKTVLKDASGNFISSYTVNNGENTSNVVIDIDILRVNGSLRLIAGDSGGHAVSPPAALGSAGTAKQLNWRDIPPTN